MGRGHKVDKLKAEYRKTTELKDATSQCLPLSLAGKYSHFYFGEAVRSCKAGAEPRKADQAAELIQSLDPGAAAGSRPTNPGTPCHLLLHCKLNTSSRTLGGPNKSQCKATESRCSFLIPCDACITATDRDNGSKDGNAYRRTETSSP